MYPISLLDPATRAAVAVLRPVLQKLDVQHLEKTPHVVPVSGWKDRKDAVGMRQWVIMARQAAFKKGEEHRAFGFVSYDERRDCFVLAICVDKELFVENGLSEQEKLAQRTNAKRLAVHELVHGFAFMYAYKALQPGEFRRIVNQLMRSRVEIISAAEDEEMETLSVSRAC